MNSLNSIAFSLTVAGMGMLVVFIFLGALYLIMVGMDIWSTKSIRKREREKKQKKPENEREIKDIGWIIAALSAFLEKEEEKPIPSSEIWAKNSDIKTNWLLVSRLHTGRTGIF